MENILIVVSDTKLLGDLSDCCREAGFTPHGLTHGSYVLPWIGERAPAAIILDTQADGVNAFTLCREISASSNASVFVLTQGDSETDQLKAEGLGVKAFLSQPCKPAAVFSQVKALLS
ncbi:MAG: response regulator [Gammaproteobacteria bacterium]|nr:response regulator [Gammaproteobacteria bacterium]MBQ0840472.1 response regulator [Gammaproteobacteria bacterium]